MADHSYREARTPAMRGKELAHLEASEGEEGGHIIRHHFKEDGMQFHKPKEYSFGADEGEDVMDHLRKHLHIKANAAEHSDQEKGERESETEGEVE